MDLQRWALERKIENFNRFFKKTDNCEKETNNMKLMIASDIHGSAYYCERLMKRFYEEKPESASYTADRKGLPAQACPS